MFDYLLPYVDDELVVDKDITKEEALKTIEKQSITDAKKFDDEICDIVEKIQNDNFNGCHSRDDLIAYFQVNVKNEKLRILVLNSLFDELEIFFDKQILKKLSNDDLKDYISRVFECTVINSMTVEFKEKQFDDEYFLPIMRIIKCADLLIVKKGILKENYVEQFREFSIIDDDVIEYIWDLFFSNRSEIAFRSIFNIVDDLSEIKDKITVISEIFKQFSKDNGD